MLKHPGGIITARHFGTKLHFCFQRSIIFMNGSKGGLRKYVLNFWPHTFPSIFALPERSQSAQLISLRYLAVTFSKSRGFPIAIEKSGQNERFSMIFFFTFVPEVLTKLLGIESFINFHQVSTTPVWTDIVPL